MPNEADKKDILTVIKACNTSALGITSSPSTTIDITIDITDKNKRERALGQMVYFAVEEDGQNILVIGQIMSIETQNRWHEDPSFKGVIKRHERLPHLSDVADNRIAVISVQACYALNGASAEGYILGTSPSTGEKVKKMDNEIMQVLMQDHVNYVTYLGKVYGTDVDLPFWLKHFGKTIEDTNEIGAGDAYHIGVFGKTGSGKTVTAAYVLIGYAKNKNNMSILVLDPQGQFFLDQELLPNGVKLEEKIKEKGMKYEKLKILEDIYLPSDRYDIFSELLISNGFVDEAFGPFYTPEKRELMGESVKEYLEGRFEDPKFNLNNLDSMKLLNEMFNRFLNLKYPQEQKDNYSKYVTKVWAKKDQRDKLVERINHVLTNINTLTTIVNKWQSVVQLFASKKMDNSAKKSIDEIVSRIVKEKGNFIILDISPKQGEIEDENVQALFINVLENRIVKTGAILYSKGQKSDCLIVMDEAHRFVTTNTIDERIKDLKDSIIDAVRTTRKYGIGYMFITQTIESIDEEILRQMRIFAFGYGLTSGQELHKVSEIINNPSAIQLYRSFIDPSSNHRFPFMVFGPISPLSFTGSPLFLEVYTDFNKFK